MFEMNHITVKRVKSMSGFRFRVQGSGFKGSKFVTAKLLKLSTLNFEP
jgi:hypothetical protein